MAVDYRRSRALPLETEDEKRDESHARASRRQIQWIRGSSALGIFHSIQPRFTSCSCHASFAKFMNAVGEHQRHVGEKHVPEAGVGQPDAREQEREEHQQGPVEAVVMAEMHCAGASRRLRSRSAT